MESIPGLAFRGELLNRSQCSRPHSNLPEFFQFLGAPPEGSKHPVNVHMDGVQAYVEAKTEERHWTAAVRAARPSRMHEVERCSPPAAASRWGHRIMASWSLAPRKLWHTRKPSAIATVVIQISIPNFATSESQTSFLR
jgi:hypothetical protein